MGLIGFIPLACAVVAWAASAVATRLSALTFTSDGVEIRNFPARTRRVDLPAIDRFDQVGHESARLRVRSVHAVLLLRNGSRLVVRRVGDPELGTGVTGLNNRLEEMRRAAPSPP